MTTFEVLLIAAEDVQPGDWLGEPTDQAQVCSVKQLAVTGMAGEYEREEWSGHKGAEGVKIYSISARAGGMQNLVVGRSLLALVDEPVRVTRPVDTAMGRLPS